MVPEYDFEGGRTSPTVALRDVATLTPRERECLRLVYERRTTKEIARLLDLSPGTVFRYIKDAQTKLDAPNRRVAAEALWVSENPPIELGGNDDWVEETAPRSPSPRRRLARRPGSWLPIRIRGSKHNELNPYIRIAWVFIIPIAFAIGFGMLATGAQVVSDLLGKWLS